MGNTASATRSRRVIDIITRRTRMRHCRRRRPLVRVRVAVLVVVLSPFLPHLSRILYVYITYTFYMYNDLRPYQLFYLSALSENPLLASYLRPCALPFCYSSTPLVTLRLLLFSFLPNHRLHSSTVVVALLPALFSHFLCPLFFLFFHQSVSFLHESPRSSPRRPPRVYLSPRQLIVLAGPCRRRS